RIGNPSGRPVVDLFARKDAGLLGVPAAGAVDANACGPQKVTGAAGIRIRTYGVIFCGVLFLCLSASGYRIRETSDAQLVCNRKIWWHITGRALFRAQGRFTTLDFTELTLW